MTHRERMEAVLRGERPDCSTALDKEYAAYGFAEGGGVIKLTLDTSFSAIEEKPR